MQNGSHLWQLALQKRKEGRCPLEPEEVAVILRAMGYPKETQIYVASGQVYGGQNRIAPLKNMFPSLVRPLILFLCSPSPLMKWLNMFYEIISISLICSYFVPSIYIQLMLLRWKIVYKFHMYNIAAMGNPISLCPWFKTTHIGSSLIARDKKRKNVFQLLKYPGLLEYKCLVVYFYVCYHWRREFHFSLGWEAEWFCMLNV